MYSTSIFKQCRLCVLKEEAERLKVWIVWMSRALNLLKSAQLDTSRCRGVLRRSWSSCKNLNHFHSFSFCLLSKNCVRFWFFLTIFEFCKSWDPVGNSSGLIPQDSKWALISWGQRVSSDPTPLMADIITPVKQGQGAGWVVNDYTIHKTWLQSIGHLYY